MLSYDQIKNNCLRYVTDNNTFPNRIVMQYTGLKDKNGKEIYEGDIVNRSTFKVWTEGENFQIKYMEGCFIIYKKDYGDYLLCDEIDRLEVIGNIYENPKLLEE